MSVNPAAVSAAAAAASNTNATVQQLIAAELNALAADAQALQSQLTAGQVVTAQVLPSNGLTDLINILGNRVAAALPPNLAPGDLFTAQVTGFNGTQILLQVLNTLEPGQAAAPPPLLNAAPTETLPDEPLSALAAAATRPDLPDGVTPSMAPPPAVFVAASVRPPPPLADGSPAPAPVVTPPPSSQVIQPPPVVLADIEARLAAARAGSIGIQVPAPNASPAAPLPAGALPAAPSAPPAAAAATPAAPSPPPAASPASPAPLPPSVPSPGNAGAPPPLPIPTRFQIPPMIMPSARFSEPAAAGAAPAATPAAPAPPPATGLAAFRDPAALVRALNLPVTPTNIASARLALDTPQRLPAALATLESALPQADDPRVATLRTLSAWLGKMEPSSPQLAAQISSFVDNVVTGNESKLTQMLTAQLAADEPANAPAAAPAATEGSATTATVAAPVPEAALPVVALAQIAERGAALTFDLKTQLFSLINSPPLGAESADDLVPAAASALTAITAVQMNAAQAMNASPQTMSFTLPMWLGSGYAQARIAIDRDAPEPGTNAPLDGSNFHIAFVLDTKNLGTVTVDLQTVGRAFSLAVKAENESTAKRFGAALDRLTGRLETLRYRVNSAEATVAARGSAATGTPATPAVAAAEAVDDAGNGSDINVRA
jgi:hypothetical protein